MSETTFKLDKTYKDSRIEIKYENGLVVTIIFTKYSRTNINGDFISFELMVFDERGEWFTKKVFEKIYDDVIGHIPINKLDVYLKEIKNYKMVKEW